MPYTTKQYQAVLQTLEERGEQPVAAPELAEGLRRKGVAIGLATVYRQLERLAEAGKVHKIPTETGALYQYCPRRSEGRSCFLLRCAACGRLEHLDCPQLLELYRHLEREHRFRVDPRQTVLTGLCGNCAEGAKRHENETN